MALVMGAVGRLLPKLAQLLIGEYNLQSGIREKIDRLSRELQFVQLVLEKADEQPADHHDKDHGDNSLLGCWAQDLRDASYDMEDIIDVFLVQVDGPEPAADPHLLRRLRKKVSKLFKQIKGRRKIAGSIQDIMKKLQEVAERHDRYITKRVLPPIIDPRIYSMNKTASELVGIEGQMDKLTEMLSIEDGTDLSDKTMKIVFIVGFGGLGKTTLAKVIHDKIKPRFDCAAFVPVGRHPEMTKVFCDILFDLDKKNYKNIHTRKWDERQLINEIHGFLQEKRYFVVIDDIWDNRTWDFIKCAIQDNKCGSRLIATTRGFEAVTNFDNVYKMQPLSYGDSKELLCRRIVCQGSSPSDEVYDKILKKCGGVPLAINTISSLLASKPVESWSVVYNSIGFGEAVNNSTVKNTRTILFYSYNDLPSHLKPCLLYLSIFPEDYRIKKNLLIWRWIAEGFVYNNGVNIKTGLFELGESYFNELINRNMIQPVDSEYGEYEDCCRVHDMVLDLIYKLSSKQNFVAILDSDEQHQIPTTARRLALQRRNVQVLGGGQLANMRAEKVRSFSACQCSGISVVSPRFRVLRVLSLEDCAVQDGHNKITLENIGSLLHLRYLGLRNTRITELPKSVGDLKFLQTLDLWGAHDRTLEVWQEKLPEEVGQLTQLLCLRTGHDIGVLGGLIGKLTSLQELRIPPGCVFAGVPNDRTRAIEAGRRLFVKELGNLRELMVVDISVMIWDEDMAADLLQFLRNLHDKIRFLSIGNTGGSVFEKGVTWEAGLASFVQLQHLSLECFHLFRLPAWLNPSLLSYLSVQVHVVQEQDMETLGRLPNLRFFKLISYYSPVLTIRADGDAYFPELRVFTSYSSLVRFDTHGCKSCKGSAQSNFMPKLESLECWVYVRFIEDANLRSFGLENLGRNSLKSITTTVVCTNAHVAEVEEVEAALAHGAKVHPNTPNLNSHRLCDGEDYMLSADKEPSSINPKVVLRDVHVWWDMEYEGYFDFLSLLTNPCVDKFVVTIDCDNATYWEVEEAEEAAWQVVDVHPNFPTLEITRNNEERMVFSEEHQQPPKVVFHDINVREEMEIEDQEERFYFALVVHNPCIEKFNVSINCENAKLEEVEEAEAAAREAVNVHLNHPTIEITRYNEDDMVLSDQQQEEFDGTSD